MNYHNEGRCTLYTDNEIITYCTYWCVKLWDNSDSMHPAIFNNRADIFFCINMSFVVVSTLEINKQKQTDGWMNNNIIISKPGEWMDAVCHALRTAI